MSCSADQTVWEGSTLVYMARVTGVDDVAIQQAGVATSGITRKIVVVDTETGEAAVTLTTTSVVFNTLQTDNGWDADTTGYNFKDIIAGSLLAFEDKNLQIQYSITCAGVTAYPLKWCADITTRRVI